MECPAKRPNLQIRQDEKRTNQNKEKKKLVDNFLTYDVLRIIFKHLTAKELSNAAHLCRTWRDAAKDELFTRRIPECYYDCCVMPSQDEWNTDCPKPLGDKLNIKPAIVFISTRMQEENEWNPVVCFCASLPSNCNTIQMGGYEIVENESKIPTDKLGVVASASLPQMPGLIHKVFQINAFSFKHSTDADICSHADKMVKKLLPTKNEKRCIILLANQHGYRFNKLVLKGIQEKYKPGTISLWGGVCVDLKLCDFNNNFHRCSQNSHWTGMYISSPSMESYSLVMSQSCRSEPQMIEKLEKLRKSIKLQKHSLGLMFACIERVKRKDLEIKAFKKVFPQVPLVGLHGDGEYGLNTLNTKREGELHHSYSTIFLILSYA